MSEICLTEQDLIDLELKPDVYYLILRQYPMVRAWEAKSDCQLVRILSKKQPHKRTRKRQN